MFHQLFNRPAQTTRKSLFGKLFSAKFDPDQPRDNQGRWTDGSGNSAASRSLSAGYSKDARVSSDGKIHTGNVEDAVRALHDGREVVLDQPKQVSTLLDRLSQITKEARAAGDKAPLFDLCKVSVRGANLFCAESKGIPRVKMPQLKGSPVAGSKADKFARDRYGEVDLSKEFRHYLESKSVQIVDGMERADYLKASQNELNGGKVAGLAEAIRNKTLLDERLFVSKDNYIVDGHHRWAATVGVDFDDNKSGDLKMKVARVNMDIITLLAEANRFANDWGIPQASVKTLKLDSIFKFDPNQPRAPEGSELGGQWISTGDSGAEKADKRAPQVVVKSVESLTKEFGGVKNRRGAADVAQALSKKHSLEIERMMDGIDAKSRPTVLLHRGDVEKGIPTVWALGWSAEEGTDIHDHANSEAGVHVLRGAIVERVYGWDKNLSSEAKKNPEGISVFTHEREARAGTTLAIAAPYVHEVFGSGSAEKRDITVHAYYPPLKEMGYYVYDKESGKLKYDGEWGEDKPAEGDRVRKCGHCHFGFPEKK